MFWTSDHSQSKIIYITVKLGVKKTVKIYFADLSIALTAHVHSTIVCTA